MPPEVHAIIQQTFNQHIRSLSLTLFALISSFALLNAACQTGYCLSGKKLFLAQLDEIEEPDGQFQDIVLYLPRGDGTHGHFGGITPTPQVARTEWFRLDQEARKAFKQEDYDKAEQLFNQAITEADRHKQTEPGLVNSLVGLSFTQHKKGNFAESDRLYEYAMRNLEGLYGRSSTRFADFLADLAWLYAQHGKQDKAELLYKHEISTREKTAGQNSLELMECLKEYARFLRKTGRDTEARLIDSRIENIKEHRKTD